VGENHRLTVGPTTNRDIVSGQHVDIHTNHNKPVTPRRLADALDNGAPRTEALRRRAWSASGLTAPGRAIIAVPLIMGLVTLFVFMAISSSTAQG